MADELQAARDRLQRAKDHFTRASVAVLYGKKDCAHEAQEALAELNEARQHLARLQDGDSGSATA